MSIENVQHVDRGQQIFSFFESDHAAALIEYAKHIARIDTDFTIFMARKAARLHDLLRQAGCDMPSRSTMLHYVLEQDLERFRGKSVTLVDDTLILGSTLARAKIRLEQAGVSEVNTVVFAVDEDEWDDQLIHPNVLFKSFAHQELLSFCAAEVQALAAHSIPYLSDFPFFEPLRLSKLSLLSIQSLPFWETYPLTVETNTIYGVACYSILPESNRTEILGQRFGPNVAKLVDICKLRVYVSRNVRNRYSARIVPIATLRPIADDDVGGLFDSVVSSLERSASQKLEMIRISLKSNMAQLRFVQYILSLAIGRAYMEDISQFVNVNRVPEFSLYEAAKLFGPWLRSELGVCHSVLSGDEYDGSNAANTLPRFKPSDLPYSVASVSQTECEEFLLAAPNLSSDGTETRTLRTDLEAVFLSLHSQHEIPARQEVRQHGAAVFDLPADAVPHRDRLQFGFAWKTIVAALFKREKIKVTPMRSARLSLLLDMLIDNGVAVPFLCEREGVIFRAYRHGEDVPFANQEAALAYDIVAGFIEATQRETVPKQYLEKLLVSLIKVGVSRRFLVPIHNINGSVGGIVRVGYHLHGAVANFPSGNSALADDRDSWLSSYLVGGDVLRRSDKGYALGVRPEASTITSSAPAEAEQIGSLLGLLSSAKSDNGEIILSMNDLTVLATCTNAKDCALALVAELKIVLNGVHNLPAELKVSQSARKNQLTRFLNQHFYTALHSARMKLAAYRNARVEVIFDRCSKYLASQPNGKFLERQWKIVWGPLVQSQAGPMDEAFRAWIDKLGEELRILAEGIFAMELALSSASFGDDTRASKAAFKRTCEKISSYLADDALPSYESKLRERLVVVADSKELIEECNETYQFGLRRCKNRNAVGGALVHQVSNFAIEYGRNERKQSFMYCVWYDIINSTGQKSDLKGDALKQYRKRIEKFKDGISERLAVLKATARDSNVVLYPWSNTLTAKDDEKNVFISGPRCDKFVTQVSTIILNEAESHGVRIRIVSCDTAFAGAEAFKFESDADVHGEAFWEHGSRLRAELKSFEDSSQSQMSYVWLCGKLRKSHKHLMPWEEWKVEGKSGSVRTEIENYPVETYYFGGTIKTVIGHWENV